MLGNVGDKKPVTIAEAHAILESRSKEGPLGYEQTLALEHAAKFKKLSVSKANEMKKELIDIGISDKVATKIVDILPARIEILKQVLILEHRPIDEGQVNEAMQIIAKYKGK